jgi:hypothetical protein
VNVVIQSSIKGGMLNWPEMAQKTTTSSGGIAIIRLLYVGSSKESTSDGGTKIVARNITPIAAQMPDPF